MTREENIRAILDTCFSESKDEIKEVALKNIISLSADVVDVERYENAMQKLRDMPRFLNDIKAKQIQKISAEADKQKCEWVPVSKMLPKIGEQVLCCDSQSRVFTSALTEIASNGMAFFGKHCKVIAWMPLPTPYKESEI